MNLSNKHEGQLVFTRPMNLPLTHDPMVSLFLFDPWTCHRKTTWQLVFMRPMNLSQTHDPMVSLFLFDPWTWHRNITWQSACFYQTHKLSLKRNMIVNATCHKNITWHAGQLVFAGPVNMSHNNNMRRSTCFQWTYEPAVTQTMLLETSNNEQYQLLLVFLEFFFL